MNAQGFLPALKKAAEKQGSATLAFVNSFGGKIPLRNMSAYTASKFALAGFVDAIRPDMQQAGVQVSQIHPGTAFLQHHQQQ
jgi:short-subunit dehydrogenase